MMRNNFAVFILTNGRAQNVVTYKTLRNQGYTGKIYLLVDNEDKQKNTYIQMYGDEVYIFDKQQAIDMTDAGDTTKKRGAVVFARNICFEIAAALGVEHFIQLDDDYKIFRFQFDNDNNFLTKESRILSLDKTFDALVDFKRTTPTLSVAMAQSGDYMGGENGTFAKLARLERFSRKVMNSFVCSSSQPFKFMGRINEDVNAYVLLGSRGNIFITTPRVSLIQKQTQSNSGGLTDIYLDLGTYVKSFYTVMYSPSCVTIGMMGQVNKRLHHKVRWKNAVPAIISETYSKH